MGFQVKFFLSWSSFLLLLLSCNSTAPPEGIDPRASLFTNNTEPSLEEQLVQTKKNLIVHRLELEWLNLRKIIVEAEIRANEATSSELMLERELLKYQNFDNRFPAKQGFISDLDKITWQSKLKVKQEETRRLKAAVRLLNRDMIELEAKLKHEGFRYEPKPRSTVSGQSNL